MHIAMLYVVVTFGSREAAADVADTFPEWTTPHIMRLVGPGEH
jgi:hypothetical protein